MSRKRGDPAKASSGVLTTTEMGMGSGSAAGMPKDPHKASSTASNSSWRFMRPRGNPVAMSNTSKSDSPWWVPRATDP